MTDSAESGPSQDFINAYMGYRNLPPLAGVHTMAEAVSVGLSVSDCVNRLKRLHWSLKRLHSIFVTHIPSMPVYELKMAFSLHAHYTAEHVSAVAARIREMRQPPYGLEVCPDEALDIFFDEIQSAPEAESLLFGLYEVALPAVNAGFQKLVRDTNRLFDHPTFRVCRFALIELKEVQEYGAQAIHCMVSDEGRKRLQPWSATLSTLLASNGGLDGTETSLDTPVERYFSKAPWKYDPIPRRDERFRDPYNMGVNAEAMLFSSEIPARPKTLMLYFKRMREIDVPEMMSSILAETMDKPWEYRCDMTRQLWDEARHAMMGEVGFVSLGIDWTEIPFNFTWSLGLNTILSARERHAVLYTIEQGLMPKKTGKEFEWEIAIASASPLAALIQDYDWADEILHAQIGRRWIVPEIGGQKETMAFGDEAWSRILLDWRKWKEEGLTEHRNWWPDIYRAACRHWGVDPDPYVLGFDTSYEMTRADLKPVVS